VKILLVGSGGREHALALLMAQSAEAPRIAVVSNTYNPGLERIAKATHGRIFHGNPVSPGEVLKAAEEYEPDLVVIGPEEPLFAGVADTLIENGYTVYGPRKRLANIERDKSFARNLMWRYRIPGRLRFNVFQDPIEASNYAKAAGDVVIKPARQAGGRGVRVFAEPMEHLSRAAREAAAAYAQKLAVLMSQKYSDIEAKIIVEERVEGVEYSLMAVTDGETLIGLPAVQDHPHLYTWDIGPETGGMGSIAGPTHLLPFLEEDEYQETLDILKATVKALANETKLHYTGTITGQMMLTSLQGPTLIEYYARFGDPEIGNLIYMIESSFVELLDRAASRRLSGYNLKINEVYTVNIAVAPAGYPNNRETARNHPVKIDEAKIKTEGCTLLYAGVTRNNEGTLVTTGSRIAEIVCPSTNSFEEARKKAIKAIQAITLTDNHPLIYRTDIGSRKHLEARLRKADHVRRAYRRRRRGKIIVYDWIPGKGLVKYDYS